MPGTTISVPLENLFFDPDNPRLPADVEQDQMSIFRYLVDEIQVDDLLNAIATGGIIEADPIIVAPFGDHGNYKVIEGNRRLAAIKLLSGRQIEDGLAQPRIPKISDEKRVALNELNVQADWPDKELHSYLGYKHVTSTKEWGPEAKAKFVLSRADGDLSNENLRLYAQQFGTTLPTLKRWLSALLTLQQAERIGFDVRNAANKRFFGTFYTLLGGEEVKKFIGLNTETLTIDPVPEDKRDNLMEFAKWSIGTRDEPAVVNSRTQKVFEAVLASPEALAFFRLRPSLDMALLYTAYKAEEIAYKLRSASVTIEGCLLKLNDVRDEPNVQSAFKELESAYKKAQLNMREA